MEEIERLLPNCSFNYRIKDNMVNITHKTLEYSKLNYVTQVVKNIDRYKFMHDNWDYFDKLIKNCGYTHKHKLHYSEYKCDNFIIMLEFDAITITERVSGKSKYYKNPKTMMYNLQKFLGVEPLNKLVNRDI